MTVPGYWPGPWSGEDGGPDRRQTVPVGGLLGPDGGLEVTSRTAVASTMVVTREPGEVFLLGHTAGDDAVSFVERIDPRTLEPLQRSADLDGGPAWPGSIAAHADGSLVVVFGNHAHKLTADLAVEASVSLPRPRPYNGFVVLPDGTIVTKDFAGSRPGSPLPADEREPCQLVALDPEHLGVVATLELPEPSVARLSADGSTVYVVGDTSLLRARFDGSFHLDEAFAPRYRTRPGQTYGWDCAVVDGAAYLLDDGEGSDAYDGTLRGHGTSTAPLQLHRADLTTGALSAVEVSGRPGGLVANPPIVDPIRHVAVAYDSGNGVLAGFTVGADGDLALRWRRDQDHGAHLVLFAETGEVVTGDYDATSGRDQVVVLDVATGTELARADTGSPLQGVLFPARGFDDDVYLCTFSTVTRLAPR